VHLLTPEFLSVLVQEVDPDRVTGPAPSNEVTTISFFNENVSQIAFRLLCILEVLAILINFVRVEHFDVRIYNHGDSSACGFNLPIHLLDLAGGEILRVEHKIFVGAR